MAQVKVCGLLTQLKPILPAVSDAIHSCVVDGLPYPRDQRIHRYILLEPKEFVDPAGRTVRYTIVEFSMFEGCSVESKKNLIRCGFRGRPGDEHNLGYRVEV